MFVAYILYVVIVTTNGVAINTFEYQSEKACKKAAYTLKLNNNSYTNSFTCIRKGE